jgi:hypothetical protein
VQSGQRPFEKRPELRTVMRFLVEFGSNLFHDDFRLISFSKLPSGVCAGSNEYRVS